MSIAAMTWAWSIPELTQGQRLVLMALADRANDEGVCWPSQRELAFKACASVKSVQRYIQELRELGLIQTVVRATQTGRRGLRYCLAVPDVINNPSHIAHSYSPLRALDTDNSATPSAELESNHSGQGLFVANTAKRQIVALRNSDPRHEELEQDTDFTQSNSATAPNEELVDNYSGEGVFVANTAKRQIVALRDESSLSDTGVA